MAITLAIPIVGAFVKNTNGTDSINNTTTTALTFPNSVRDDAGFWSSGANTKLTAPTDGWYLITAGGIWDGNLSGLRISEFRRNNTNYYNGTEIAATGANPRFNIHLTWYCTAGDYFEVTVYQNRGGTRTIGNAFGEFNYFSMVRLTKP